MACASATYSHRNAIRLSTTVPTKECAVQFESQVNGYTNQGTNDIAHFISNGLVVAWIDFDGNPGGNLVVGNGNSFGVSVTTTASLSDVILISAVTPTSFVSLTPTNASAAADMASGNVYVLTKSSGSLTIAHGAIAGMTFDIVISNEI